MALLGPSCRREGAEQGLGPRLFVYGVGSTQLNPGVRI